ncbi:MAG: hypothetical protein KBC84_00305 [Proteobacteria bacterium]|nr:hypothetical protein [Pseudomonadota bacterium]
MSFVSKTDKLWSIISEVAEAEGLLLYDLERLNSQSVRVSVTKNTATAMLVANSDLGDQVVEQSSNVTIGECSKLCRRLMVIFQAEGKSYGLGDEPEIDVSSPGINKNLRLPEHFSSAIGEKIKVVTLSPIDKNIVFVGTLVNFGDGFARLKLTKDKELEIPLELIKKANVEFEF